MKKSYVSSKAISKTRKNQEKILMKIEEEESEKRYLELKAQQSKFQKRFAYLVFGLIAIFIWVIFITWKL